MGYDPLRGVMQLTGWTADMYACILISTDVSNLNISILAVILYFLKFHGFEGIRVVKWV